MESKEIEKQHHKTFEQIKQVTSNGTEFWYARDLQVVLDYSSWDKFKRVINKAISAYKHSQQMVENHFSQLGKMVKLGSGSEREIEDYQLSRYACYLIVQNGDPSKPVIANGQTYFAMQTRRQELAPKKVNGALLNDLKVLIEQGKKQATVAVNSALTLTYWHIGKRINDDILQGERAEYGKQVVLSLAEELVVQYGKSFEARNLRRMMQFAELFPDFKIVSPLVSQLSWTHFTILMTLPNDKARFFYIKQAIEHRWSKRELQRQIERKAFERSEIADTKLTFTASEHLSGTFKDPYFLDFLGLKDGYLENDLESALIKELEQFILELGKGFAFVERQKRMIIDGEDFSLDLLFFHRKLKRLVAVELKIDRFKAAFKGQMELYLNWLNKYERQSGEEAPIGLILCTEAGVEQVELLNMQKDNIMVAEYWTELPPKELLEKKLHTALIEVRERLADKKLLDGEDVCNA